MSKGRGSLVSPDQRAAIRNLADPLAAAMARAGLTPNALTLIGFAVAVLGAVLLALGLWLLGGVVATVAAAFDMLDGAVARLTGTTSRLGAFLDSTFDRWAEGVVYLGIVAGAMSVGHEPAVWLATAALVSAFMVSYTRARAESLGFSSGTGMAAVGLAPREVRTVILAVGLIGGGLLGGIGTGGTGELLLDAALALIAVLASVTVIQRILFVRGQASPGPDR
jgi:CDP-diacylglycerol---glycerol-3-phosphate 3-phosphatidyltransferase